MKTQSSVIFISFLLIAAGISFFIGLNIGKKNTKLVYLPGKNITVPPFSIKGSYTVYLTGKVKNIDSNSITITSLENNKWEGTFVIKENTEVLMSKNKSAPSSTQKVVFNANEKVPLTNIQVGKIISINLLITEKEASIKTINILD